MLLTRFGSVPECYTRVTFHCVMRHEQGKGRYKLCTKAKLSRACRRCILMQLSLLWSNSLQQAKVERTMLVSLQ